LEKARQSFSIYYQMILLKCLVTDLRLVSTQENYPWIGTIDILYIYDWNGQENFSLSCGLWVGTNDFNTKKNVLVHSNPRIIFLSGN
jgi:hypothetical protein